MNRTPHKPEQTVTRKSLMGSLRTLNMLTLYWMLSHDSKNYQAAFLENSAAGVRK